ncbi:DedA family protein [Azospirillum halopraeferens]|uniref:DedA family protein n=1 Tax=Azospirillum halopraeferens TaxID=34010 RepID=UPI000416C434|nr:DedA family protein [Azospirillum halopraeferens]
MEWIDWLREWGDAFYPIAFLWSFFEGETFVIFGGWAASMGILDLNLLILSVWLGSFMGDQCWFWMGRKWGVKALDRFPAANKRAATVHVWLERYGVGFILSFRFLYGIRNIASVALGTSKISWRKFMFWNFIAAGMWAVTFAGAGYLFGEAAASFGETGTKVLVIAVAVVVAAVVTWKSIAWNRRRLDARRLAAAQSAAAE